MTRGRSDVASAALNSREDLKKYCRKMLGEPVVKVDLTDEQAFEIEF